MAEPLSRDEFLAHIGYIRDDIAGVHQRLDVLNGRTRATETAIVVLQTEAAAAEKAGQKAGRTAGAIAGSVIGGVIVAIYKLLGGGQ